MSHMAYRLGNIPCAGDPVWIQHGHKPNGYIWRTVCGNIAHEYPLETITKLTHGLEADTICFNFMMLLLCQSFPFSGSIADALATLIICVFPRLSPRIRITTCALAFHVHTGDGGASLASRTMITLIMKLMIWCCRLIMHYKILGSITR
jgi:hypothetical protein